MEERLNGFLERVRNNDPTLTALNLWSAGIGAHRAKSLADALSTWNTNVTEIGSR